MFCILTALFFLRVSFDNNRRHRRCKTPQYTLTSPDGSVTFQLQHNVAGRTIYAEGTADAVKFLARKLRTEHPPTVYNMINVLEAGALE